MVVGLVSAGAASAVGCYAPPAYSSAYQQDSKGYAVGQDSVPAPQPRYVGVDPGLAIAGVAAAGLLGYAIGDRHDNHHHDHYRPHYYRPVPYRRVYYGHGYHR